MFFFGKNRRWGCHRLFDLIVELYLYLIVELYLDLIIGLYFDLVVEVYFVGLLFLHFAGTSCSLEGTIGLMKVASQSNV